MGIFLKSLLCYLVIALYKADFVQGKKPTVFCYLTLFAALRNGTGTFTVKDSDTEHCTHIVYSFMSLNYQTSEIASYSYRIDHQVGGGQLKELKLLKEKNPNLKVLASVGGYCVGSRRFSELARSHTRRAAFINSLIQFVRKWELDGMDIAWQFPGYRGGRPGDRENFVSLLKEIKRVFSAQGWLLTAHIWAKRFLINISYDVKSISEIVDYINLAAMDYHRPRDGSSGIAAPLTSLNENNVDFMVNYTIRKGANPSKILLGLPTFGRDFAVEEDIEPGRYLGLLSGKGFRSPGTNKYGLIAYYEICKELKLNNTLTEEWDQKSSTPVAYKGNRFVSFEDEISLIEKVKLVNKYKLGGIMLFTLDTDDFNGQCNGVKYPLLTAVTEYLENEDESTKPLKNPNNLTKNPENVDKPKGKIPKRHVQNEYYGK